MEDVISLGVGEPDFDTPWHIRDEGIYTLEKGRTFYTSNSGLKELRVAIAEYLRRRFEVSYDPLHEILVTVGGSEGIDVALRAMLDPGDEVLIPEPCYVSYVPCVVLADGVPVTIELKEENQFRLTKEELLAAITDKTKILVMPFPNNPTGGVMRREDLEEIAQVCIEKDIYVLSDEIYSELTYGADHVSIASLPGMKERTLLINGFSLLITTAEVRDEIFENALYGGSDWRYIYYFEPVDSYYLNTKLWQVSSSYNNRQPLLRMSEMYLIAAECATTKKEALDYLNTLRRNRGFEVTDDLQENITDEKLQEAIGKEYRKEFIGEGQWFFYCKRTDQATLPNVKVPFSKAYYVLPIPDQELEYGNRN